MEHSHRRSNLNIDGEVKLSKNRGSCLYYFSNSISFGSSEGKQRDEINFFDAALSVASNCNIKKYREQNGKG